MNLKEYFEMGRKQAQENARKAALKKPVQKKLARPSATNPLSILVVAGVAYEMFKPVIETVRGFFDMLSRNIKPTIVVIKTDIKMLVAKARKVNPDWELYKRFDELARGKK